MISTSPEICCYTTLWLKLLFWDMMYIGAASWPRKIKKNGHEWLCFTVYVIFLYGSICSCSSNSYTGWWCWWLRWWCWCRMRSWLVKSTPCDAPRRTASESWRPTMLAWDARRTVCVATSSRSCVSCKRSWTARWVSSSRLLPTASFLRERRPGRYPHFRSDPQTDLETFHRMLTIADPTLNLIPLNLRNVCFMSPLTNDCSWLPQLGVNGRSEVLVGRGGAGDLGDGSPMLQRELDGLHNWLHHHHSLNVSSDSINGDLQFLWG